VAVGPLAEPGGGGAEPVADGLRDVSCPCFQGGRAVAEPAGLLRRNKQDEAVESPPGR
jgi:hypothetical protein